MQQLFCIVDTIAAEVQALLPMQEDAQRNLDKKIRLEFNYNSNHIEGNGRISRLLMNYVLLQHYLPPVVINSVDKKAYLFALNRANAGDIEAFITYIAEQLIWSLELYLKAAKGESLDEPGDLDKKLLLFKKKLGEDAHAKVELKYGEEAINLVIQNTLIPLSIKWEEQLKKFEPLFNSRSVSISYNKEPFFSNQVTTAVTKSQDALRKFSIKSTS